MREDKSNTEIGRLYENAQLMRYDTKDLLKAMELYESIIAKDPESPEAEYSRTQIQNIVKLKVPKQELLNSNAELARTHIERDGHPRPRWVQ